MTKPLLLLALIPALLSGCGTFIARTAFREESHPPRYYPATCIDGYGISRPFYRDSYRDSLGPKAVAVSLGSLVDLPISLATDTLCLPLDIWAYSGPHEAGDERIQPNPQGGANEGQPPGSGTNPTSAEAAPVAHPGH
jgi:uncharacterized protein YceK